MPSKLFYLNYYVLQWFGIRLARKTDDNGSDIGYKFLFNIKPMSGWNTDYEPLI